MTAQSKKSKQKRLDRCVVSQPKGPNIREKLLLHARRALKVSDFVADTVVRVENTRENGQPHHNATLLGKYRSLYCPKARPI